jgi:hypothetical protein
MAEELQPTDDLVEKAKADRAATRNIFGRVACSSDRSMQNFVRSQDLPTKSLLAIPVLS